MNELNQWYQRQLKKLDVEIELGAKLDAQAVLYHKPDAVVLAVGAAPVVPKVPGIERENVVDCVTALTGKDLPGENILVVGGGLVGCGDGPWYKPRPAACDEFWNPGRTFSSARGTPCRERQLMLRTCWPSRTSA